MVNSSRTQYAVELVGAGKLILNTAKLISRPGRRQILCRVEAVGLCFSDLKLSRQFSSHVRKGPIVRGIDEEILREIPSYVPGDLPTVPGHEAVVRIEAVGDCVENFKRGQRYLVETDYRWLATEGSNAAFGYNFEGALQQYVLMDERIITSPDGESMLLPVSEQLSASQTALIEPWACVEHSYRARQRREIKTDGRVLIVADMSVPQEKLSGFFARFPREAELIWLGKYPPPRAPKIPHRAVESLSQLPDGIFNDVIYFGCDAGTLEAVFTKVAPQGLLNIVLCGGKFGREVVTPVGKVHYSAIRIIGTGGFDPAESMKHIPAGGEIRPCDKINIIGAAGPMGLMHVIRNICSGLGGLTVFAGDTDDKRLAFLSRIASGPANKSDAVVRFYNPSREEIKEAFDNTVVMVPQGELIGSAVTSAAEDGIINIFAGIDAEVSTKINLDTYIAKRLYFIGTSGSEIEDMKLLLAKAEAGELDTNVAVGAVCGLAGATDGIGAVEKRSIPGKIVVYPACQNLGLIPLKQLEEKMPDVAESLNEGIWTKQAEDRLLEKYTGL